MGSINSAPPSGSTPLGNSSGRLMSGGKSPAPASNGGDSTSCAADPWPAAATTEAANRATKYFTGLSPKRETNPPQRRAGRRRRLHNCFIVQQGAAMQEYPVESAKTEQPAHASDLPGAVGSAITCAASRLVAGAL